MSMERKERNNLLERINFLARKSKLPELTDDERLEQKELREQYLKNFRINLKNKLDAMNIKKIDSPVRVN